MFIRHGEKPGEHGPPHGIDHNGEHDEHALSVRGWTRAGALAGLFAFAPSPSHPGVVVPEGVYATKSSHDYKSKREVDTATPVAQRLGREINTSFEHGQEEDLSKAILDGDESVLVVWHHGSIPDVLKHFPISNSQDVPKSWPEHRFDVIWVLTRTGAEYQFSSVDQALLEGDESVGASGK